MNRNLSDLTGSEFDRKNLLTVARETDCPDDPQNGYWLLNDEIKTPTGLK
jgi:hypothetical protein